MKKSITIFSLSILCLFLFSGCSFNFAEKKEKASVKLTTYCSSDFGIEFKYPSDWSLQKDGRFLYLYQGGVSGRIGIMNGGSFSEVEKMTDNISSSEIINLAGTKVLKRTYLPIKPKNMAASAGYYFLAPQDKFIAVMNYYSDRNSDILDIIANSVKLVGNNGCDNTEKNAMTTKAENVDTEVYSLKVDNKNPGWNIYEDKTNGLVINFPDPLVYVADAGSAPLGNIIFQIQFPYSEDGGESADMAKMTMVKYDQGGNNSLNVIAEEAAKETAKEAKTEKVIPCVIGDKKALCFNAKLFYNNDWLDNYLEKVFFENKGFVYEVVFYSSGEIKSKFKDIFQQVQNKFEFIE